MTVAVEHGKTVIWRVTPSPTTSFTGAATTSTSESSTVDCPVIDPSASASFGVCQNGSKVSTLTISNSANANTAAFFRVS